MKKNVTRWVSYMLNDLQKVGRIGIARETLEVLDNCGHRIPSKAVTYDKAYIPFYNIPTRKQTVRGSRKIYQHQQRPKSKELSGKLCMLHYNDVSSHNAQ